MDHHIPEKANRVFNVIILGLLLILIRVWYLSVIQHDEHLVLSRKPQRRSVIEHVERATIRDRFNIPLALNKMQYAAAVCYADIRSIPSVKWEKGPDGKPRRVQARANYVHELSQVLAQELNLDAQQIEDTIHGKASLFPHTPFVLKEDISEELYYRLKLLEPDWVGIHTTRKSTRYYPRGKVGSDVIGYMGAISSNEYFNIAQEIKLLQSYLLERESGEMPILPKNFNNALEVRERLRQLQEKAYTINDLVGKAGIEATFDEELRGYFGKKIHEIDTKGNFLRELPGGRKAVSGQRILLSISSELQEYAEQLLAEHEQFRDTPGTPSLESPWIKGGAIVALDPKTGEVLALASYPRFDPNDFIPSPLSDLKAQKQSNVFRWLESEAYVGEIWDGKRPLERERFDPQSHRFYDQALELNWQRYLRAILPENSTLFSSLQRINNLSTAYQIQHTLEKLLPLSQQPHMNVLIAALYSDGKHHSSRHKISSEEIEQAQLHLQQVPAEVSVAKQQLAPYLQAIAYQDDQLLLVDLCRLIVNTERFSDELLEKVGNQTIDHYRELSQSAVRIQSFLQTQVQQWFHTLDFQQWRDSSFKEFLKHKRKEEKQKKQYARPYTEYLEQLERASFKEFWERYHAIFVDAFVFADASWLRQSIPALEPYLTRIHQLRDTAPLYRQHAEKLQAATRLLSPEQAFQYLQTMRPFQELSRPLYGRYRSLRNTKGIQLEKHLAGAFYPLSGYGYGRSQAFRQSTPLGSVFKVVVGYQALLEKYQQLAEKNRSLRDLNPLTLVDKIQWTPTPGSNNQVLGYTLEGTPIHRLYKGGRLPRSHPNIGKVDLIGALEQSSNIYFAILAGDYIENPWNLIDVSRLFGFGERSGIELPGEIAGTLPSDLSHNRTGLYSFAIGQHSLVVTPLQTAVMLAAIGNKGHILAPKIVQIIAGNEPCYEYRDPFDATTYPFQESLNLIGIDFPLFTATQSERGRPQVWYSSPTVKRTLFFPPEIQHPLIDGMHKVISGPRGTARPNIIRLLNEKPSMRKNFNEIKDQLIGKTGTAEILYKHTIDAESEAQIHNHIWFGGVSFDSPNLESAQPELAVAVYLRFSESGGKEAAPLATELVKKWREICAKHGGTSHVPSEQP
jgi:cell division protein FtsI/penicillin-binding protein 2